MPFITATGLTETSASKTVMVEGIPVRYHDIGSGAPVLFLHHFGPGMTAWIAWHRIVDALAPHYRCLLMDLPNYGGSGPVVFKEVSHEVTARVAVGLLDALGIERAAFVGCSYGGHCGMVAAIRYPERVSRLVLGGGHLKAGSDNRDVFGNNRPSEGIRAVGDVFADPSKANVRRYLSVMLDDQRLVTDELVDYIHQAYTGNPAFIEARARSANLGYDYTAEIPSITAPTLMIHGRYDRLTMFEVSIALLNHITDSRMVLLNNCGHWPAYEKPDEYTGHLLSFLRGYAVA